MITNANHNAPELIEKSKESDPSIPYQFKFDPILMEIFKTLPKDIPIVIINIISDYSFHDPTIDEYYDRIKNELMAISERVIPNLYDPSFIIYLSELVKNSEKGIPKSDSFWDDLARFLFKYTLSMRRTFSNDNQLFEKSVKDIKDIMIIPHEKGSWYIDTSKAHNMTDFDLLIFDYLVKYEIFDHPQLLEAFIKNIINKDAILKMTLNEIEKRYCNGNFNNNPLLQLMLIRFAFGDSANQQMIER